MNNLPNVFSALHKYGSGAPENYLTEAFVFLLKGLLDQEATIAFALLNHLTGIEQSRFGTPEAISIATQVTGTTGRPDITITQGKDFLVFVEVKHDSSLGLEQLEKYRDALLRRDGIEDTRLVLLARSRSGPLETTLKPEEYHQVCWYEIYDLLAAAEINDTLIAYFVSSFLAFLEEKNMSIPHVQAEYAAGIPAMLNLMRMMDVSIKEALPGVPFRRTAGWSFRGFYLEDKSYWYGMWYERPMLLLFENNGGANATYSVVLDLEKFNFFNLASGAQLELLVKFLREAYGGRPNILNKGDVHPGLDESDF